VKEGKTSFFGQEILLCGGLSIQLKSFIIYRLLLGTTVGNFLLIGGESRVTLMNTIIFTDRFIFVSSS